MSGKLILNVLIKRPSLGLTISHVTIYHGILKLTLPFRVILKFLKSGIN